MVSAVLTRDLRLIRLVVHYMLEDARVAERSWNLNPSSVCRALQTSRLARMVTTHKRIPLYNKRTLAFTPGVEFVASLHIASPRPLSQASGALLGVISWFLTIILYFPPSDTMSFPLFSDSECSRHHHPPSGAHAAALRLIPPDLRWLLTLLRHRLSYNAPRPSSRTSLVVPSHGYTVSANFRLHFCWIIDD